MSLGEVLSNITWFMPKTSRTSRSDAVYPMYRRMGIGKSSMYFNRPATELLKEHKAMFYSLGAAPKQPGVLFIKTSESPEGPRDRKITYDVSAKRGGNAQFAIGAGVDKWLKDNGIERGDYLLEYNDVLQMFVASPIAFMQL